MPPGSILAHCVHCGPAQVGSAERHGLWIVQNPRSNRGNRVGYPAWLADSSRVALGTDGYPADMDDEVLALEEESAKHGEDPVVVRARLAGGHILAGERFGLTLAPLAPDHTADVVARAGGKVRHVMVDGKLVVQDGQLMTADIEEIRARAEEQAPLLWERMERY